MQPSKDLLSEDFLKSMVGYALLHSSYEQLERFLNDREDRIDYEISWEDYKKKLILERAYFLLRTGKIIKKRLPNLYEIISWYAISDFCDPENDYNMLHYAVDIGSMEAVDRALSWNIPLDAKTKSGKTALDIAVEKKHEKIPNYLVFQAAFHGGSLGLIKGTSYALTLKVNLEKIIEYIKAGNHEAVKKFLKRPFFKNMLYPSQEEIISYINHYAHKHWDQDKCHIFLSSWVTEENFTQHLELAKMHFNIKLLNYLFTRREFQKLGIRKQIQLYYENGRPDLLKSLFESKEWGQRLDTSKLDILGVIRIKNDRSHPALITEYKRIGKSIKAALLDDKTNLILEEKDDLIWRLDIIRQLTKDESLKLPDEFIEQHKKALLIQEENRKVPLQIITTPSPPPSPDPYAFSHLLHMIPVTTNTSTAFIPTPDKSHKPIVRGPGSAFNKWSEIRKVSHGFDNWCEERRKSSNNNSIGNSVA